MIYEVNLAFCAVSVFFFKNFLTFAAFLLFGYLLFKYLIQKLSNISIILYLLLIISIIASGIVISLIPSKEDVLCPIMVNSYYLGPVVLTLLIGTIISIIVDIFRVFVFKKKIEKKPIIKKRTKKVKKETKKKK